MLTAFTALGYATLYEKTIQAKLLPLAHGFWFVGFGLVIH